MSKCKSDRGSITAVADTFFFCRRGIYENIFLVGKIFFVGRGVTLEGLILYT